MLENPVPAKYKEKRIEGDFLLSKHLKLITQLFNTERLNGSCKSTYIQSNSIE